MSSIILDIVTMKCCQTIFKSVTNPKYTGVKAIFIVGSVNVAVFSTIRAKVVEYPMAMHNGTVLVPLSHSLFDDDAICRYAYHQGKTKVLVSGLKSLCNFKTVGDQKLSSVLEGDIEDESGDEGDELLTLTQLGEKYAEKYVGV
jgi:hypothetical protein